MYIFTWCDWEGILHEHEFTELEDAQLEAAYLAERYDGVEIIEK